MLVAKGTPEPKEVEVEVNCDDPREAVIAFHGTYGFWPDYVEIKGAAEHYNEIARKVNAGTASELEEARLLAAEPQMWDVVGGCESCGQAILDGDEYGYGGDVLLCGACAKEDAEESERLKKLEEKP